MYDRLFDGWTLHQRTFALAISVGLAACGETQPAASHATAPPEVSIVTVSARSVALTKEPLGRIAPIRIAEVRPRVSGIIPTSSPLPKARVEQVRATRQIPQTQQPVAERHSGNERQHQLHKKSHGKPTPPYTGQLNLFG
jgi:hypothetical protein